MLMSMMAPDRHQQIVDITKQQWEKAIDQWEQMDQIVLYEEMQKLLCRVACEWVGVPLKEDEVNKRAKSLASLFVSAVSVGPAYWLGRNSRKGSNEWVSEYVQK